MFIPIISPTGYTYSCTVEGSSFKIVQCEQCRFVYVYKMTRRAAGSVSDSLGNANPHAAEHAEAAASFQLNQKLRDDCDAIPCLECGQYQQHMIEALRWDFMSSTFYGAWFFLGVGVFAGIIALISLLYDTTNRSFTIWLGIAAVVLGSIGGLLLSWRTRQLARYDPNEDDLAERLQISTRYARTLEEFQAYLKLHGVEWELPKLDEAEAQKAPAHRVKRLPE